MGLSGKFSNAIGLGSLSRLSQLRSLFQDGKNQLGAESLSPIKQIILRRMRPILESEEVNKMVPGLQTGISIVLSQVSDQELTNFIFDLEGMLSETLDEIEPHVRSYAASEGLAGIADAAE